MARLKNYPVLMIILALLVVVGGCGYHFSPGGESIDKNIKTVYVEPINNKTGEANAENIFRSAFIDWFSKGNRFKVVDQPERADALWKGTIQSITTAALSYRAANLASEERMTVVLDLKFVERDSQNVIWSDNAFSWRQDYPIADPMNTESSRKMALSELSRYAAERAYRMMMSGF